MDYMKHIVCFMDILGFKEMIKKSATDYNLRKNIFNMLSDCVSIQNGYMNAEHKIAQFTEDCKEKIFEVSLDIKAQMSVFSDSIILSYYMPSPRSDLFDLNYILHQIALLNFNLLYSGFFIRGGLTYGDLCHNGNICYGPALIESVKWNLCQKQLYLRFSTYTSRVKFNTLFIYFLYPIL